MGIGKTEQTAPSEDFVAHDLPLRHGDQGLEVGNDGPFRHQFVELNKRQRAVGRIVGDGGAVFGD